MMLVSDRPVCRIMGRYRRGRRPPRSPRQTVVVLIGLPICFGQLLMKAVTVRRVPNFLAFCLALLMTVDSSLRLAPERGWSDQHALGRCPSATQRSMVWRGQRKTWERCRMEHLWCFQ